MSYDQILDKASQYLPHPIGLVTTEPTSHGDKTLVRQLNTVILLLLELQKRVERLEHQLIERTETITTGLTDIHRTVNILKIPTDLDKVIEQIKALPSGVKPFSKSNKFFRIQGSVDPKQKIK